MTLNSLPVTPALPLAPTAMPTPGDFAMQSVGRIAGFLGGFAGPVLGLAIGAMGLKMIVTGKKPRILGGDA